MYEPYYDEKARTLFFVEGKLEDKDYFGGIINVFVCGPLQDPNKMRALVGRSLPFAPAVTTGFVRRWEKVEGKDYFFMIFTPNRPENILTGVVWLDLTRDDLKKIEVFELRDNVRKRVTIKVQVGDRTIDAITFIKK